MNINVKNADHDCCFLFGRVQEIMTGDQRESGRIPRTIDCELMNDLGGDNQLLFYNILAL